MAVSWSETIMQFFFLSDSTATSLLGNASSPTTATAKRAAVNLPAEIIDAIANHVPRSSLPTLARINKAWYSVVMPRLYQHIHICTRFHWNRLLETFRQPQKAQRWGPCVQSIVLRKSPPLVPAKITSMISVRSLPIDDNGETAQGYVRIQRINYDTSGLENEENYDEIDTTEKEVEWLTSVTNDEMATVLQPCSQLAYLDLSACEQLGDPVVQTLSMHQQRLKILRLCLFREMTPEGLYSLIAAETKLTEPSQLRQLDLSFCRHLDDNAIIAAVKCWGCSLTHLRLNSLYDITDRAMAAIARYCPNLRLLHVVRCWQVSNDSLHLLSRSCPDLIYLSLAFLNRANEVSIGQFIRHCKHLKWLDVTGCGINSLFKSLILESWKREREALGYERIHFEDTAIHLL
ncbi:uncharacterized protein BYT42DRAFT_585807 [Radiomyces spectabilis]|uniref:uncharacterized protein n=1 Tax=Radiomyces spectabilis TaxID=64574 RepID=UPI00221ED2B8|nr:uncharacterized protein BYT42DRAFT_585807 [Radiomyces spectabilis]KAI8368223.1 hypothetical protein BYT42DRAFT_585807 [Radiomyces spectabilis]